MPVTPQVPGVSASPVGPAHLNIDRSKIFHANVIYGPHRALFKKGDDTEYRKHAHLLKDLPHKKSDVFNGKFEQLDFDSVKVEVANLRGSKAFDAVHYKDHGYCIVTLSPEDLAHFEGYMTKYRNLSKTIPLPPPNIQARNQVRAEYLQSFKDLFEKQHLLRWSKLWPGCRLVQLATGGPPVTAHTVVRDAARDAAAFVHSDGPPEDYHFVDIFNAWKPVYHEATQGGLVMLHGAPLWHYGQKRPEHLWPTPDGVVKYLNASNCTIVGLPDQGVNEMTFFRAYSSLLENADNTVTPPMPHAGAAVLDEAGHPSQRGKERASVEFRALAAFQVEGEVHAVPPGGQWQSWIEPSGQIFYVNELKNLTAWLPDDRSYFPRLSDAHWTEVKQLLLRPAIHGQAARRHPVRYSDFTSGKHEYKRRY